MKYSDYCSVKQFSQFELKAAAGFSKKKKKEIFFFAMGEVLVVNC